MRTSAFLLTAALALSNCSSDAPVLGQSQAADAKTAGPDSDLSGRSMDAPIRFDVSSNTRLKPIDPCDFVFHPELQDIRNKSLFLISQIDKALEADKKDIKKPKFAAYEPEAIEGARVVKGKKEVFIARNKEQKAIHGGVVVEKPGMSEFVTVQDNDNPVYLTECGGGGGFGGEQGVDYAWEICSQGCHDHDAGGSKTGYMGCDGGKTAWVGVDAWGIANDVTPIVINEQVLPEEVQALIACVRKAGTTTLKKFEVK